LSEVHKNLTGGIARHNQLQQLQNAFPIMWPFSIAFSHLMGVIVVHILQICTTC